MKTILLVLNGPNTVNTIAFGCYLASITKARLVGVYVHDKITEATSALKQMYGMAYVESIVAEELPDRTQEKMEQHMWLFKETCRKKAIPCSMFKQEPVTLKELLDESRFADLIVADAVVTPDHSREEIPDNNTRILLAGAECPVMLTPYKPGPINEVVYCYDGSEAATYAMKQLVYLFPEMDDVKATVLEVRSGEPDEMEQKHVTDWLSRYYNYAEFVVIDGKPEDELFNYLAPKKNTLVVMGAYGRSWVSRFFHQSRADKLIKQLSFPLFIAHH